MFTRLTPILPVLDVAAELEFYLQLGFTRHVDPDETYPVEAFAAVACGGSILFGLARHDDSSVVPAPGLDWQLETADIDAVHRTAEAAGLQIASPVAVQSWGRRAMTITSPSGYAVVVEQI